MGTLPLSTVPQDEASFAKLIVKEDCVIAGLKFLQSVYLT